MNFPPLSRKHSTIFLPSRYIRIQVSIVNLYDPLFEYCDTRNMLL